MNDMTHIIEAIEEKFNRMADTIALKDWEIESLKKKLEDAEALKHNVENYIERNANNE